jgi:hypothetical protein
MVRPLVDLLRPWLANRVEVRESRLKRKKDSTGAEYSQHFLSINGRSATNDQQIHKVVSVRQPLSSERVDRNGSIQTQRLNVCPSCIDCILFSSKTVHKITLIRTKGCGEFSIAAAQMHDQPTRRARVTEDLSG